MLLATSDAMPGAVKDSQARRRDARCRHGMLLSAEGALVASAARSGVSLIGSTCYLWPLFTDAASIALLIHAGVRELVALQVQVPIRLQQDLDLIAAMTGEAGVLWRWLEPPKEWYQGDSLSTQADSYVSPLPPT